MSAIVLKGSFHPNALVGTVFLVEIFVLCYRCITAVFTKSFIKPTKEWADKELVTTVETDIFLFLVKTKTELKGD